MQEERWNALVMMSSSAPHGTATVNGVVTGKWARRGGHRESQGTDVDYQ